MSGTSPRGERPHAISPSDSLGATIAGIGQRGAAMKDGGSPDPSGPPPRVLPACAAMERPIARAIFWGAAAKLAWTQVGYGAFLSLLRARAATLRSRPTERSARRWSR